MKRAALFLRARPPVGLGALFRDALQLTGVGLSGVLLGCGSKAETSDGFRITDTRSGTFASEPGFVPLACSQEENPQPLYLKGLRPDPPVDSLELFGSYPLREQTGAPCSSAANVADCEARLEGLPRYPNFVLGQVVQVIQEYHLRVTRGSEVLRVGTTQDLHAFLGAIDSLGDAQIWVASQNYSLLCGESGASLSADGIDVLAFTHEGCDGRTRHLLRVDAAGTVTPLDTFVERIADPLCVVGRRPEGLQQQAGDLRASVGEFFAHSAALEAVSVPAFLRLSRELLAQGAPLQLASRAIHAAQDEVRHARAAHRLARAYGGTPRVDRVPVGAVRSLEAVALENAVEGCVRETYGALVAWHQQEHARDRRVVAAYRRIAQDETRHAELSWQVARWAEPRLSPAARRRVQTARSSAAAELIAQVRAAPSAPFDDVVGLPSPAVGHALAERLDAALWRS